MTESRPDPTNVPDAVSIHDRTGDVLVWSADWPSFRIAGRWETGEAALRRFMPSADELKDDWSPVTGPEADRLRAEAAAARSSEG